MRLSILAIGKMKKGPESELLDRYLDRGRKAGGQFGINGPDIREWAESRAATAELRKQEEADQIIASLKPGGLLVALDENGKDFTSVQLAEKIRQSLDNSVPEIAFCIGGPDGHGETLLERADLTLRMGRMTWPHQLARVMLAEQVYRAMTIMAGHPYHRV